MRFRRSIKILPGVRLNLSKSGLGISVGPRGLKVGMDARGRKYISAGIPGTGLSSRQYLKPSAAPSSLPQLPAAAGRRAENEPACAAGSRPFLWIVAAGVLLAGGLVVSVTRRDQPATAPARANLPRTNPSPAPTPEQAAIVIARGALSREHPTYVLDRITTAGAAPVRRTPVGFDVRLQYRTRAGAVLPYICKVAQQAGICAARTARMPPGVASGRHVGPRGGAYHYSSSGRKVYERR